MSAKSKASSPPTDSPVNTGTTTTTVDANDNNTKTAQPKPSPTPDIMTSPDPIIDNLNAAEFEHLLMHTLSESNRLAKDSSVTTREVAMAKMVNYCIRMLHSNGWNPSTVVRAMVHMEAGGERSVKGCLYQALRERRNEGRVKKEEREKEAGDAAAASAADGDEGVDVAVAAAAAVEQLKIKTESK